MFPRTIISRYLIKEIVYTLAGVVAVLFMIFLSAMLGQLYSSAASGNLEVKDILTTLGLQSIANLPFLLPLSFYIAILLAFSRLYRDNEMVVLQACGISQGQILRSVMVLVAIFAVLMAGLSLYVVPWSESRTEYLFKQAKQRNALESLSAGRFKELTRGEGVVYVQDYDSKALRMNKVFMQDRVRHKNSVEDSIITANSGYRMEDKKTGDQFLILEDGFRFEQLGHSNQTAVIRFKKHGVRIEQRIGKTKVDLKQHAMTTLDLWRRGTGPDHAELQWRVSTPLLMIVLAMLGIPLSRSAPRQSRFSKLALALLIYIIYFNLLNISRSWLNNETISVWIGMWWVHLSGLILALAMLVRWQPLLRRFWHGR